jgi:hypothetical protein
LLLTGCFYLDPINRRPKIMDVLRQCDASDPAQPCDTQFEDLHHGDSVNLKADFMDPDGQAQDTVLQWKITACDSSLTVCDGHALYEGTDPVAHFVVRNTLEDTGGPVQRVSVGLFVFDDRGASSSLFPVLIVKDGPTLAVSQSARTYTVGAPIDMFATYGDPDDGPVGSPPSGVAVQWTAFTPDGQPAPALIDLEVPANPADPGHPTVGERLIPEEVGAWDVRVTATNSHSITTDKHLLFTVGPDQPPCLAQWQPIVPPDDATLPVTAPTVFQALLVDDDLDPYPAVPGEPLFGTTAFEWSILVPGAQARQRLVGTTGNSVDFDPGAFTPGDVVELRVEIFDRKHTAVACPDGALVCPANVAKACNQRQTWRVEIR